MKKRIIAIVCSVVLLLSMTFSVNAREIADDIAVPRHLLTGEAPCQVTRTCRNCNNRVANVYCTGGTNTYFDPTPCALYYHGTCTISSRERAYANAYCSYCGYSYGWDWDTGGHVESCEHLSSSMGVLKFDNVCNYGPRA